jgi:hypothetical protein
MVTVDHVERGHPTAPFWQIVAVKWSAFIDAPMPRFDVGAKTPIGYSDDGTRPCPSKVWAAQYEARSTLAQFLDQ